MCASLHSTWQRRDIFPRERFRPLWSYPLLLLPLLQFFRQTRPEGSECGTVGSWLWSQQRKGSLRRCSRTSTSSWPAPLATAFWSVAPDPSQVWSRLVRNSSFIHFFKVYVVLGSCIARRHLIVYFLRSVGEKCDLFGSYIDHTAK